MPCYFVSNGVEMSMTDETFDFIWNSFRNKELTDSDTSSSSKENYKAMSSVQKRAKPQWRKHSLILQQKTERQKIFPKILPRENETTVRMRYMRFCREL